MAMTMTMSLSSSQMLAKGSRALLQRLNTWRQLLRCSTSMNPYGTAVPSCKLQDLVLLAMRLDKGLFSLCFVQNLIGSQAVAGCRPPIASNARGLLWAGRLAWPGQASCACAPGQAGPRWRGAAVIVRVVAPSPHSAPPRRAPGGRLELLPDSYAQPGREGLSTAGGPAGREGRALAQGGSG